MCAGSGRPVNKQGECVRDAFGEQMRIEIVSQAAGEQCGWARWTNIASAGAQDSGYKKTRV